MATIKSFTSLEQSRKLVKILPLESADMCYQYVLPKSDKIKHNPEIGNPVNALKWYNKGYTASGKGPITLDEYCVPCWSLATLLNVLPVIIGSVLSKNALRLRIDKSETDFNVWYDNIDRGMVEEGLDIIESNPVDACVEMIIRLSKNELI